MIRTVVLQGIPKLFAANALNDWLMAQLIL